MFLKATKKNNIIRNYFMLFSHISLRAYAYLEVDMISASILVTIFQEFRTADCKTAHYLPQKILLSYL